MQPVAPPASCGPGTRLSDLPAPAKINLFLHVVGRRDDGYHLLESVFVLIDWADSISLSCRADGDLIRHDLGPALPADDLCLRAARALQQASSSTLGADIHIHKHLPWGAGMGGGSSDAATTLLALNHLWGLRWPRQRLADLALRLGADVPFFIHGHNAFVQGVGEHITPLDLPPLRLMVVKPQPGLDTRAIFAHPLLRRNTPSLLPHNTPTAAARGVDQPDAEQAHARILGSFDHGVAWPFRLAQALRGRGESAQTLVDSQGGFGHNDLQAAAQALCPEVVQACQWLESRWGNSRMTGSGSAVFARLDRSAGVLPPAAGTWAPPPEVLASEAQALCALPAGWVGRLCVSLPQHPLWAWGL